VVNMPFAMLLRKLDFAVALLAENLLIRKKYGTPERPSLR
jgi:hypothetical protein